MDKIWKIGCLVVVLVAVLSTFFCVVSAEEVIRPPFDFGDSIRFVEGDHSASFCNVDKNNGKIDITTAAAAPLAAWGEWSNATGLVGSKVYIDSEGYYKITIDADINGKIEGGTIKSWLPYSAASETEITFGCRILNSNRVDDYVFFTKKENFNGPFLVSLGPNDGLGERDWEKQWALSIFDSEEGVDLQKYVILSGIIFPLESFKYCVWINGNTKKSLITYLKQGNYDIYPYFKSTTSAYAALAGEEAYSDFSSKSYWKLDPSPTADEYVRINEIKIEKVGGENAPPVAEFTPTSKEIYVGEKVTFDASASRDYDGSITEYHWEFEGADQSTSSLKKPEVKWENSGIYTVKLKVKDDDGAWSSFSLGTITVKHRIQLEISADKIICAPKDIISLHASVKDLGGNPTSATVSYQIIGTDIKGTMPGLEGEYGYGVKVPAEPGDYQIKVTAKAKGDEISGMLQIKVLSGNIGVDVSSILIKMFPNSVSSQQITISNTGSTDLKEVTLSSSGDVSSWISFSSPDIDWQQSTNSFKKISAEGDTDRVVTVTITTPDTASIGTRKGNIKIASLGGESITISVTVNVIEKGQGVKTSKKYLSDDSPIGWDVYKDIKGYDKRGDTYVLNPGTITLTTSKKVVCTFDPSDIGLENVDPLGYIIVEATVISEVNEDNDWISVYVNGEYYDCLNPIGGLQQGKNSLQIYFDVVSAGGVPRKISDNTIEMKASRTIEIKDVKVTPGLYHYDSRDWEDDFSLSSERVENLISAYLQFDVYAMSGGNKFPVYVYFNGAEVGTLTAEWGEGWNEDQKVTIDVDKVKSSDNVVTLITYTDGIYNIKNAKFYYTYVKSADIDVDFNTDKIDTKTGDEFTLGGTILNDGGKTATNVKLSLNYDSSNFQLLEGTPSYNIGNLDAGELKVYNWKLKALKAGSHIINLKGTSDQDDESDSVTVTVNEFGVDISASETSKTISTLSTIFNVTITNTGTTTDKYTLSLDKTGLPKGWVALLSTNFIELSSTQSNEVQVQIWTTPSEGSGFVKLTATSNSDKTKSDSVVLSVTKENNPPYKPYNPSPSDNASDIPIDVILSWSGGDPDGGSVTYDVYFGTSTSPPLVSNDQPETTYDPSTLNYDTKYYWKIVAKD
ncbi:hypothetical protein DRN58_06805, partial [Thermococci archaeon]